MNRLSEAAIIKKIKKREIFTATIDSGAFTLKIEKYDPAFSAAIHDGGNFRSELERNCLLSQAERYFEEDPYTGSFIEQQPITLVAHDSRYEYDLNRNTDECVYETAGAGAATMFLVWNIAVGLMNNVLKPILLGRGVKAPMAVIFIGAIGAMGAWNLACPDGILLLVRIVLKLV